MIADNAAWLWTFGFALVSLAVAAAVAAWRRSDRAVAATAFRTLGTIRNLDDTYPYLDRVAMKLPARRRQRVFEHLARRLERASGDPRELLAESVRALARITGMLAIEEGRARVAARRELAVAMEVFARATEALAARARSLGIRGAADVARPRAAQARLFAALLRAESPSHLAALRPRLRNVRQRFAEAPASCVLDAKLLEKLGAVLDALEQLSRLPGAEDRALYLGQALTQTLRAEERLAQRYVTDPTHSSAIAVTVLESLRQLLATSIQDIHQRAELVVELRSKVLTTRREAVVVLELKNVGQGPAYNIAVELHDEGKALRVLQPRQDVTSLLRRQSARLEFLVEPRVSDRLRLTFHITYGDLEQHNHRLEIADVVEFRQIPRRTFLPLYPNPYVVGRPLADSDVFIDREEIFRSLAECLRNDLRDQAVLLIGQRRMGKTSILRRLPARLGNGCVPVLIDLQGFLGAGEAAFFRQLAAVVHDDLAEAGVAVDEPPAAAFAAEPAAVFRQRFLRGVADALGDRHLVLLFDEYEVLEERIRAGDLGPPILGYLRELTRHESRTSLLFAGTHRLEELTCDDWSAFVDAAVYVDVGHLPRAQVEELFTRPTRQTFEIDPLALDKIYQVTGGHPHFSQLLARELVDFCNREKLPYVTVQDVNVVTETVVDKGQLHITYLWDGASRSERLLLLALKELIEREGLASAATAHRYLSDHRIEPGDLAAAARRLERTEILHASAGQLSFRMDLLRRWLARHHDLESFGLSESGRYEG